MYRCKDCGRHFSESTSYEKIKFKKHLVNVCVNLRSLRLSYRDIQRALRGSLQSEGQSYYSLQLGEEI